MNYGPSQEKAGHETVVEPNPTHVDYEQVFKHFRTDQNDYIQFQHQYLGWAMYCLAPMKSHSIGSNL